jgi:hypothetical protein
VRGVTCTEARHAAALRGGGIALHLPCATRRCFKAASRGEGQLRFKLLLHALMDKALSIEDVASVAGGCVVGDQGGVNGVEPAP